MSVSLHAHGTLVVLCKVAFLDDVTLYIDRCSIHRVCGATLVAQTSFASVQLFVLSFCLDDFALSAPFPIMVMQPVWLVMSPCKVYAASTHVFNILILCIDRVRGMLKVC